MEYVQKLTSRWTEPLSDQVQKHKTGYDRYNINMIMALFRECLFFGALSKLPEKKIKQNECKRKIIYQVK